MEKREKEYQRHSERGSVAVSEAPRLGLQTRACSIAWTRPRSPQAWYPIGVHASPCPCGALVRLCVYRTLNGRILLVILKVPTIVPRICRYCRPRSTKNSAQ
jgi:hypothetical protein